MTKQSSSLIIDIVEFCPQSSFNEVYMAINNNQRTFVYKTIAMFRDVRTPHFHNIKWLRTQLGQVLSKQMINKVIEQHRL